MLTVVARAVAIQRDIEGHSWLVARARDQLARLVLAEAARQRDGNVVFYRVDE